MSIFAAQAQGGARGGLFEMQCGKATLAGTTVTADPRKGLLSLKKSEDGLMHLVWKDRSSQAVEDDLIVFQGDATLRHLAQCKDGYVMLLEFTQTKRKLFFWSQERRKKGLEFSKLEDVSKEKSLLEKANRALNGTPEPAPAATGFGGLTHSELMAMLSGGMAPPGAAPAAAPSAGEPAGAADAAPASGAAAPAAAAPSAAPASSAPFSSDAISSILGNLGTTPGAAAPAPAAPANFTAANLSNILAAVQQSGAQSVPLSDVLGAAAEQGVIDAGMEARLAEHLPTSAVGETAAGSLVTPQVQQAASSFTEALNNGSAGGVIAEMGLNPTGLGVEPFLRALQATTPAADVMETETSKPDAEKKEDSMDESKGL